MAQNQKFVAINRERRLENERLKEEFQNAEKEKSALRRENIEIKEGWSNLYSTVVNEKWFIKNLQF